MKIYDVAIILILYNMSWFILINSSIVPAYYAPELSVIDVESWKSHVNELKNMDPVSFGIYIFGDFIGGMIKLVIILALAPITFNYIMLQLGLVNLPIAIVLSALIWMVYLAGLAQWRANRSLGGLD